MLAAAIALPPEGSPDTEGMKAFIRSFSGTWPLAEGSAPAYRFEEKLAERRLIDPAREEIDLVWREVWTDIIDDFAHLLECHDDVASLRLRGCWYLIVAGLSWGDAPDGYETVSSLSEWEDLMRGRRYALHVGQRGGAVMPAGGGSPSRAELRSGTPLPHHFHTTGSTTNE